MTTNPQGIEPLADPGQITLESAASGHSGARGPTAMNARGSQRCEPTRSPHARRFTWGKLEAVTIVVSLITSVSLSRADPIAFLATRPYLVQGRLVSAHPALLPPDSACVSGLGALPVQQFVISVDSVYSGVIDGRTLTVNSIETRHRPAYAAGAAVLAWAEPLCAYGWALAGDAMIIADHGLLAPSPGLAEGVALWRSREHRSFRLEEVVARTRALAIHNPLAPFRAFDSLQLVRVISRDFDHIDRLPSFRVEVLALQLGERRRSIERLHFEPPDDIYCDVPEIGDTLAVPTLDSAQDAGKAVRFQCCPDALRVRRGRVQGLQVPLEQAGRVLSLERGVYRLNSEAWSIPLRVEGKE